MPKVQTLQKIIKHARRPINFSTMGYDLVTINTTPLNTVALRAMSNGRVLVEKLSAMQMTNNGRIPIDADYISDESLKLSLIIHLAEHQMIIKYAIDKIKATEIEKFIPGYESVQLYHGQSLINACIEEGLIIHISLRETVEYSLFTSITI